MNQVFLEFPEHATISNPLLELRGWCTVAKGAKRNVQLLLDGKPVDLTLMERLDVKRAFPDAEAFGFSAVVDLTSALDLTGKNMLPVNLSTAQGGQLARSIPIEPGLKQQIEAAHRVRAEKRDWCMEHLECPVCHESAPFKLNAGDVECSGCSSRFLQETTALNMITPDLYHQFQLKATSNVSANPYDPNCQAIIDECRRKGGKVLDCGAGLRSEFDSTVINSEVVDYPTTDIMAVGQSLPFKDNSFDAVLSQAVLEHVSDPFACASEIVRVTKEGGTIYCVVPLNQPEHGYPNHFYNMTRQGLANLFKKDTVKERQFVPDRGKPIFSLRWFLEIYNEGLPPHVQGTFQNLTIGDILNADIGDRDLKRNVDWVGQLDPESEWRLASTTGIFLKKRAGE